MKTDRVMKTKSIIVAGLVVLLSTGFFASNAQSTPTIKVLPTTKEGIVKLLVVGAGNEAVEIDFYSEDGLVETDAVQSTEKGFNKKYDIRKVMHRGFSMEITTAGISATYQMTKSGNRLTPILVKTTHTYPLVASKD
jgi:hypothetical protein